MPDSYHYGDPAVALRHLLHERRRWSRPPPAEPQCPSCAAVLGAVQFHDGSMHCGRCGTHLPLVRP